MRKLAALVLLCALLLAACSGESHPDGARTSGGAAVSRTESSGGAAAFSGVGAADGLASKWSKDAKLYAVSAEGTDLDAEGRASGWLYSYVSRSAGGIEIVSVRRGKASVNAKQKLPKSEVGNISSHALPAVSKLEDSTRAMGRTRRVQRALRENPKAKASAGLDSFSGGVYWIFATVEGGQRVEERVPALGRKS